jgi:DNA primase catalytic core
MENGEPHSRISDALKEQIRDANDIVEVVGSYFQLKRAGEAYKADCPFHKEKTASFMVNPQRQIYHCFGCGAGGDVFKFIQQHEGVEFLDAMKILAERANIRLDIDANSRKTNPLYDVLAEANRLYRDLLRSDEGQVARDYLASRDITMDTADKFQLGFAPEGWDFLLRHLRKDFNPQVLEEAGLVCTTNNPERREQRSYDRFRNRLMFPYLNSAGKVIAFMGRTIETAPSSAKYINSPETPLFSKGKVLYGIRQAQRAIYDTNQVVIVESNSSVLTCSQNGLENVIATSGTAFTGEHRDILLKRFPESEMVFCFDGDIAGRQAAARTSGIVLGRGNTKICNLPQKINPGDPKDPDDFIRAGGVEYLKQLLAESKPSSDYLLDYIRKEKNLNLSDPGGLIVLLHELKKPLQDAPPESKGILLDWLSKKLGLQTSSIEQKVFGEGVEVRVDCYVHIGHLKRREWENRFVKMVLRDGKIPTIKYFCESRDAASLMSEPEPRHILNYLKEQASTNPLFLSRTPLFRQSVCRNMVDEIAERALKGGVLLNKRYLWYLFVSPLEEVEKEEGDFHQRRFLSEKDERNAQKRLKRDFKPTLEDMEKAFEMIKFKELMSRAGGLPFSLDASGFESLVHDLEELTKKYQGDK